VRKLQDLPTACDGRYVRWTCVALAALVAMEVSARADASCPPGEGWDPAMAMCMPLANALAWDAMVSPDGCGPSGYFTFGMSMCMPKPERRGKFSGMAMGNLFAALDYTAGARGHMALVAPDWAMFDLGFDVARWNRLELDVMLTFERWLYPDGGYPLLLQIGESDQNGQPFIDAQHPHSSPIMGLTLTDVISFSATKTRVLRLFFAPRGESTDGPIAMMHRATGTVNPDAPLGHHIGQDVGHVTSTVLGASLFLGGTMLEASAFHGHEPSPMKVDLPIGAPDSVGVRVAQQIGRHYLASASFAYVNDPEGDPAVPHLFRVSASAYGQWNLPRGWRAHATLIFGGITDYDRAPFLASLTGEWLFLDEDNSLWGRAETLMRTPAELAIASSSPDQGRWVGALTLGYTRKLISVWAFDFAVGGSLTLSFVPDDFAGAYGGNALFSGKLFLEARWLKMFSKG
jgi:hypothetical protein